MKNRPWSLRATGNSLGMVADADEVRRALSLFADPEGWCEVRTLSTGAHRTADGGDVEALCRAVADLPSGHGTYFVINPLPEGLTDAAKNDDVTARRWVFIDVDRVKTKEDKNLCATDGERAAAQRMARRVRDYLAERGWPAPVIVDSGNGVALFYRADLPKGEIPTAVYRRLLKVLADKFNGPDGTIDKSVHSAAQLARIPGTWNRKGPDSDDRPHRPCKLLSVPPSLETLTFDEFKAAAEAGESPQDSPGVAAGLPPATKQTPEEGRRALDNACQRVVLSADGDEGRNNTLNKVAFELGRLYVGPGVLERAAVVDRLYEAACEAGLDTDDNCGPEGIRKTIDSGLNSGASKPPDPKPVIGTAAKPDPNTPVIYWASEVTPRQVEWLWPGRIPLGKLTTFAGNGGLGKTFVICDIMARVSRGAGWPDGSDGGRPPARCLFISGEDDPDDTLVPRLIELGADLGRIAFLRTEVLDRFTLADLPTLDRALAQMGPDTRFVGIDPPTAYLGGVNDHKNAELRGLLTPLMLWAKRHGLSVVFNTHVNKPQGAKVEAMMRVMGSVAWVNAMRSAYMFTRDPADSDRRLFIGMKNNLGGEKKGLAYKIASTASLARVEWLGEVDTTADDAVNNQGGRKKRRVVAGEWLAGLFSQADKLPSDAIWEAMKDTTLSKDALKQAKEDMGVRARQEADDEGNRAWWWYWPKDARRAWAERGTAPGAGSEARPEADIPE